MVYRIPVRAVLLFFCISWFLGTSNLVLALDRDDDLYGISRARNTTTEPLPLDGKDGDLYSREQREEEVVVVINRPPNIQGLTGLMVMNSAFTRPAGTFAVGATAMIENSDKPDYSVVTVPITLTYGISDTIEAGLKMKYIDYSKGSETGPGDTELAVKWRWNTHGKTTPELAIGLAGIIPTASESKGLNEVKNWGAKFMVMATSETKIGVNSFLGIYLEAQAVFLDTLSVTNKTGQDRYGILNAGVLLPISSNNRLQAMIEVNDTTDKKLSNTSLREGDQLGITPALRYVTDTLSITAGTQFLKKDTAGYKDTVRWIGTISYQF